MKGIYFLLAKLEKNTDISVGALGEIEFESATYIYVGSAQNSLEGRVMRHLSEDKCKHWHIDHLLDEAEIEEVLAYEKGADEECNSAEKLGKEFQKIDDFGCSDCSCETHLFYSKCETNKVVDSIRKKIGREPFTKEEIKSL